MARGRQMATRRSQGSRPNRSWAATVGTTEVTIPAASKVLIGSFALSVSSIDETVLRTRGMIAVRSDQIATTELQLGAFGMIRVTDVALAAGVASVPGPGTDASDDGWFVWQPIDQAFILNTAVGFDSVGFVQYPIDSKSKRIIQEGEVVAIVCENTHATQGFKIVVSLRMLTQVRGTN